MKIFKLIFLSVFGLVLSVNAQDKQTEDIIRYLKNKQYNEAKKLSDELIKDINYNKNSKLWFYRAMVYHNVYELHPETEKNSIQTAYESYLKAMEFDSNKTYNNEINKALGILANQFVYEGVQLFNTENYALALEYFEKNLAIGSMPAFNQIDTVIMYNAALSAEKSGDLAKAVLYYEELIKLKFGGASVYNDLAKVFKNQGNIQKFISCSETGIRSFPDESFSLYSEIINYYLEKGDYNIAHEYTLRALQKFPESAGLHFISASLKETSGKTDLAEAEYKKTIELDSAYTDAYFNLGSIYYNKGVDLLKKAMNKDDKNKADEFYKKAMEMYEEVYKLTPDNKETIKILSNLYAYLGMTEKLKQLQEKEQK